MADNLIDERLEASTAKNWTGLSNQYKCFCANYGLPELYADNNIMQKQLMRYAAFKIQADDSMAGTLRQHMYAIRSESLTAQTGTISITSKSMPRLHAIYKARKKQKPPDVGKELITEEILIKYFDFLNKRNFNDTVFRAAFAILHNSMRRPDEIEYESNKGIDHGQLEWESGSHVPNPSDKHCTFFFTKSKMNTDKRRQFAILTCICNVSAICALCELKNLCTYKRKIKPHYKVFRFRDGSCINYDIIRNTLGDLNILNGWLRNRFTPHGFRGGGTHDAGMRGISKTNIKTQADWKSDKTLNRYLTKRTHSQVLRSIELEQKTFVETGIKMPIVSSDILRKRFRE